VPVRLVDSRAKGELDPEDDVVTAILGNEPANDRTDHRSQERREREDTSRQCALVTTPRVS
jgi:ribosome biogenesis SPOUT family RNA methylase Rps3